MNRMMVKHPPSPPILFDPLAIPLEGIYLIEANAGTGKTRTITDIFIRLLLETSLTVTRILVVTYTEAAARELRDRIRGRLRAAVTALQRGGTEDTFLNHLLGHQKPWRTSLLLKAALRDFDEAPIYTIHGFCARVLHDHAFESGGFFEPEIIGDEEPLRREVIQDYWRLHISDLDDETAAVILSKEVTVESLLALTRGKLLHNLRIQRKVPSPSPMERAEAATSLQRVAAAVRGMWPTVRKEMEEILRSEDFNKNKLKHPERIIAAMDRYGESGHSIPPPEVKSLTLSFLKGSLKKKGSLPCHPFFTLCEELYTTAEKYLTMTDAWIGDLKARVFPFLQTEMRKRKEKLNVLSFDDLLVKLQQALLEPGGEKLADRLRLRFGAALIDEFQDTDPIQYDIFRRVFADGGKPLFFIGDPKQSIYAFRGADLFAYLKAASTVDNRFGLLMNWRSDVDLVKAVNVVFSFQGSDPFLYEGITYTPGTAAQTHDRPSLIIEGKKEPPLKVIYLSEDILAAADVGKNKEKAAVVAAQVIADEAARLIYLGREGRAMIGEKPVTAGDIAVLTRTNRQAELVQRFLVEKNVPSVLHSTGSIFATKEARETERFLVAVAEPRDPRRTRAALTTPFFGLTGTDLAALAVDGEKRETYRERFLHYHELWDRRGFIVMARHVLARERVRERLLGEPHGERRITNILHLVEMLHMAALENNLGMTGLIKWLSRARRCADVRQDAHELRLESDAQSVQVVTIHKSKGLEYPIVFCPFAWARLGGDAVVYYHDPQNDWQPTLVLDKLSDLEHDTAEREALAEEVRLFYVALTRAKYRTYFVWGPLPGAEHSAPAHVLHRRIGEQLAPEIIRADLAKLSSSSDGALIVEEPVPFPYKAPQEDRRGGETATLKYRIFTPGDHDERRLGSFSQIMAGTARHEPAESAVSDRDAQDSSFYGEVTGDDGFPKGLKSGSLIHEILAEVDFTIPAEKKTEEIIDRKLQEYGMEKRWAGVIQRWVHRASTATLDARGTIISLSRIPRWETMRELPFFFPLKRLTPGELRKIMARADIPHSDLVRRRLEGLDFQPVHGFMRGFIDLVFLHEGRIYLLDWKSNHLGDRWQCYHLEALTSVMASEGYVLQYLLYSLALHRYLQSRLPGYDYDTHMGGVFYVFLRGLDWTTPGCGIYYERPTKEVIYLLEEDLINDRGHVL